MIAGSGMGQTSGGKGCRAGRLAPHGVPGLAVGGGNDRRIAPSQSRLGPVGPAGAGLHIVLRPYRKRSAAERGRCRPPCHERFRPRAVGIAGTGCVGREARTAASSGRGRMEHDGALQREIDLAEQRRRSAEMEVCRRESGSDKETRRAAGDRE